MFDNATGAPWSTQPGPLGDLPNQVAGVLNSSDPNHLYIPIGQDGIVTLPRPQRQYGAVRQYIPGQVPAEPFQLSDVPRAILGLIVIILMLVGAAAVFYLALGL